MALVAALSAGCTRRGHPAGLVVPSTLGELRLDGALTEQDWRRAARTGPFLEGPGRLAASPYSEARLLWDEQRLYLGLYAAEEALDDAFTIRIRTATRTSTFQLSARSSTTSPSGVIVGVSRDDHPREWMVECGLSWSALGVAPRPGLAASLELLRCGSRERRCSGWGGLGFDPAGGRIELDAR